MIKYLLYKKRKERKKMKIENFGLKVVKSIKLTHSGDSIQYMITDDEIPLYEINRWLEIVSLNSYKTGQKYAHSLITYFKFLKRNNLTYKDQISKKTVESYIKYLVFGNEDISQVTGKISMNTVKNKISVLKHFYDWLEDQGDVNINPVTFGNRIVKPYQNKHLKSKFLYGQIWNFDINQSIAKMIKFQRKHDHIKHYSNKEKDLLIQSLPTLRDKVIFKISLETGMRIGEILGLHIHHLDLEQGIIMIRRSNNIENEAKVKTNERDLYITDHLSTEISSYIQIERSQANIDFSTYIFLNYKGPSKGKPLKYGNFIKLFKNSAKKAGMDSRKIRTHSGRSTHAQYLVENLHKGVITETYILQQMGWNTISSMKPYVHSYYEKNRIDISRQLSEIIITSQGNEGNEGNEENE
jgi:integrase/recombinase XerD